MRSSRESRRDRHARARPERAELVARERRAGPERPAARERLRVLHVRRGEDVGRLALREPVAQQARRRRSTPRSSRRRTAANAGADLGHRRPAGCRRRTGGRAPACARRAPPARRRQGQRPRDEAGPSLVRRSGRTAARRRSCSRRWPSGPAGETTQSMNCCPSVLLHVRMLRRIHEDHAVLVEQPLVALDEDLEVAAVLERQPRAAVGEHVGVHRRGGVERRAHARAGLAVPRALGRRRCRCRPPSTERSSAMCVPLLSPRETNGAFAASIFLSAAVMSLPPATFAGSLFGPTRTKSLYITGKRFTPKPSATNFSSAALGVHEHHVGVAAARDVERLAGAERDHAHLDAGLLLEDRQQVLEQARLLGRRGRRDGDELVLRARRAAPARSAARAPAARNARRPITTAILL